MMFTPVTLGLATPEQIQGVMDKFQFFYDHPKHFLEWPSFMLPFTEAAWNAGLRTFAAKVLAETADRIYARTARRDLSYETGAVSTGLPQRFNYRIPGVANEFWPLSIENNPNPGGCENYGWGATMPTLLIRNLIGFREDTSTDAMQFILAPTLPQALLAGSKRYRGCNLHYRDATFDVDLTVRSEDSLEVTLTFKSTITNHVMILYESDQVLREQSEVHGGTILSWVMNNGDLVKVSLNSS
ncbi:MAG: hypothetical protein IPK19_11155 [Chloroflexi bacterium]|nr:hypothetical protein [Chloroflexota bacterium]